MPDPRTSTRCSGCGTSAPSTASFCGDCGMGLAMLDGLPAPGPCPACNERLDGWGLAPTQARPTGHPLAACRRCGGVWLPSTTRIALIDDAAAVANARGHTDATQVTRRQLPAGTLTGAVKYRKCPTCTQTMNRKNFGGCSGVLVDECRCGTFFDAGELEDVLAFVRSGGLLLAKRRQDEERTRTLRNAEAAAMRAEASNSLMEPIGVQTSVIGWLTRWLLSW